MNRGDVLPVTDSTHYSLPPGLKHGDFVKLIDFDHGYWTVEKDGQQFLVYSVRIDAGYEYELGGRWLPDTDYRVKAMLKATTLKKSPAYSVIESAMAHPVPFAGMIPIKQDLPGS